MVSQGDDLKVMLEYYKRAEEITVFAGDFNWINSNTDLKNVILSLARQNKIRLISNKDRDRVKMLLMIIQYLLN